MRIIEYNSIVRLYWTGDQWVLDTPDGRNYLGDCSVEDAVIEFDAATRLYVAKRPAGGGV